MRLADAKDGMALAAERKQADEVRTALEAAEASLVRLGAEVAETRAERDVLRQVCSEVLQKVLLCGVGDLDPWIRLKVIESLGAGFDEQLSQPDALRAILMALDDEKVKIRLATAALLGRLAHSSPPRH